MDERNEILEEFLPVIESQIGIMVGVYSGLKNCQDDLISDAVIKAFRLIEHYLDKNYSFNGQFENVLRKVCRQVTWDHIRKESSGCLTFVTLWREDLPSHYHHFPDLDCTVEQDIFDACLDKRDAAIVTRRAAGETQQKIANSLGISRTQIVNRLKKIGERYKWKQIERNHGRLTIAIGKTP